MDRLGGKYGQIRREVWIDWAGGMVRSGVRRRFTRREAMDWAGEMGTLSGRYQ